MTSPCGMSMSAPCTDPPSRGIMLLRTPRTGTACSQKISSSAATSVTGPGPVMRSAELGCGSRQIHAHDLRRFRRSFLSFMRANWLSPKSTRWLRLPCAGMGARNEEREQQGRESGGREVAG
eukprot:6583206-Prymnesium_polylepis.1